MVRETDGRHDGDTDGERADVGGDGDDAVQIWIGGILAGSTDIEQQQGAMRDTRGD
jgi:hypothetical protein